MSQLNSIAVVVRCNIYDSSQFAAFLINFWHNPVPAAAEIPDVRTKVRPRPYAHAQLGYYEFTVNVRSWDPGGAGDWEKGVDVDI